MQISESDYFAEIQLQEMDKVKLMNRRDTKYWFHTERLAALLQTVKDNYFILNINGKAELPYTTTYYDTYTNNMFAAHHKGKLNRYKVRRRSYVSSGISFLEVKFKSNKGRTIKKRISSDFGAIQFTKTEKDFLSSQVPFNPSELQTTLVNEFQRLTLVNKNFKERCTIDLNLQFKKDDKQVSLDNLVIVEIKSEGKSMNSPLALALRELRIKTSGFSKYCVGRTVTDPELKRNAFKGKIRSISKTIKTENNLYNIN